MTERADPITWRDLATTALLVFVITLVGCVAAFAFWLQDLSAPQVAFLGSGNRLSLLVTDGPARLLVATGDSPIDYENALTHVRPIFARRVDVLLVAGSGSTLLVPLAAHGDAHVRASSALAPLPESPETDAFGSMAAFSAPQHIRLGPSIEVTVETALPFGADAAVDFPAWRAIIERGDTRIVALSDGAAATLFPPVPGASVLAVSGDDPAAAWDLSPAVGFVANAEAISGPEMRSAFAESRRTPEWGFRVFPGEALRLRFVEGGVELPSEPAQNLADLSPITGIIPNQPAISRRVRRPAPLSRARTRP
ncbi:MAG: hypothetical protein KY456_12290 [Chloroflexi bacterium]|nr:hypothetical protein [Chloroflexota bacterium]